MKKLKIKFLKFNGNMVIRMIKGFKVKKFDTFSEAESFAIDGFCEYAYAETPFPDIIIPEKLPLNWMVYPYKTKK